MINATPKISGKSTIRNSKPNKMKDPPVLSSEKKRIHLLYDSPHWAYAIECQELIKRCPGDLSITCGNKYEIFRYRKYDLVVQMCYNLVNRLVKYLNFYKIKIPVVTTYTVGKGYSDDFLDRIYNNYCRNIIINNYGMYEQFGKKPGTVYIPNGVDCSFFKNINSNRPDKVLFIGSEYHKHTKSYDDILVYLKNRLLSDDILCDFRIVDNSKKESLMSKSEIRDWYNSGKVYVVASKSEGTPNPALEAAACGCTVVSTRVGNMPELIKDGFNGYLCDMNIDDLYNKIKMAIKSYYTLSTNMTNTIRSDWDWNKVAPVFYSYFRSMIRT